MIVEKRYLTMEDLHALCVEHGWFTLGNVEESKKLSWIEKNLEGCSNPRQHGKALAGNLSGQWRYRIGDYRLIVLIEDDRLVITALTVGHRREVYQ